MNACSVYPRKWGHAFSITKKGYESTRKGHIYEALATMFSNIGHLEYYILPNGLCFLEAVVLRRSVKKVPLEISQNSQKNACASVSFLIKLQAEPEACSFTKKESMAQVFSSELCWIFKNTYFYRAPLVAASGFWSFW